MKKILSNNVFMLRYILKFFPLHIVVTVLTSVLTAGLNIASILLSKYVIDALTLSEPFSRILIYILILFAANILVISITSMIANVITPRNTRIIHEKMQKEIFQKTTEIQFKYYDDTEFYNKFSIAMMQSDTRALAVLNSFSRLIGCFFNISGLIALIAVINAKLIALVAASIAVSAFIQIFMVKLQYKYNMGAVPANREMSYVERVFYLREYAQEIRVHPEFSHVLSKKFSNAVNKIFALVKNYGTKLGLLQISSESISAVMNAVSMLIVSSAVFGGRLSISDYVVLVNGCMQLFGQTNILLNVIYEFYDHSLYIENFREFIENTQSISKGGSLIPDGNFNIVMRDISFAYDKSPSLALNHINVEIHSGEKVAFVGHNGAGKSTLIKLIARIYDAPEGEIFINGHPIQEFDLDALRSSVGLVLQDCRMFAVTIAENVLMREYRGAEDDELVCQALKFARIYEKIISLPDGIHNPLTREFESGGAVLSGGEMQKLSLARVYARNCNLLILDEPSSALDPIAEKDMFNSMLSLGKEKTVILVSHRLECIKHADMIYVIDQRQIIESGKHEQLMQKQGKYAEMFHAQIH